MNIHFLTKLFKRKGTVEPVSVVPYVGGKKWLVNTILPLIPPDVISYVEPFGGSATVLLSKTPSPIETYNDIDNKIVSLFRVISDPNKFKKLHRKLTLTPFSREIYNECKRKVRRGDFTDEMDTAYSTYVCLRQGFNSAMDGGWSANYALSSGNKICKSLWAWTNAVDKLPEIVSRLRGVQIEHSTYEEILKRYDSEDCLFFCLPEDEEVCLENSTIRIGDISEGDILQGGNKVKRVFKRGADEIKVCISAIGTGNFHKYSSSLDHKFLVYENKKTHKSAITTDGTFVWKEAKDLKVGDYLTIGTDDEIKIKVPEYENKKVKHGKRQDSHFSGDIKSLSRLIGYFLAEGHKANGLWFSFGINETSYHQEVIELIKNNFGIETKIYPKPDTNVMQLVASSRDLEDFFSKIVHTNNATTKYLSDWVMKLPPTYQLDILKCWLKGDGGIWSTHSIKEGVKYRRSYNRNKVKITGTTTSERLAWQMYNIALRCRLHPCIKKRTSLQTNGIGITTCYDVYFTTKPDIEALLEIELYGRCCKRRMWIGNKLVTPITSIDYEHYTGTMVDIHTELGEFNLKYGCKVHNCDPPYPMEERINNGKAEVYHNEFSTEDFKKLVDNLLKLKGMVILTSYWSDAYTELINNGWVANKYTRKMSLFKRERTRDSKLPEVSEYIFISPSLKNRLEKYEEKILETFAKSGTSIEDEGNEDELRAE